MQAVILAGGRGTRLKPITDYVPKPLIPINSVPIIEWQIEYLKKFGVSDFIICCGYKTEQIKNYIENKKNFGVKIQYSVENSPLGTGGAIKKAAGKIKEGTFLVLNGDVITTIDMEPILRKPNSIALIELRTRFGTVGLKDGTVTSFREKKPVPDIWMNAGIYCLQKDITKDLPARGAIEDTTFLKYAKKGRLSGIKFKNAFWYSIDSHKDLEECMKAVSDKKMRPVTRKQ